MEDVVEQLQELSESVPIPLSLPDDDDLVLIEEQILIGLPSDYKTFLLLVSDVIYGSIEPATVTDASSHTYLPEIAAKAWDIGVPRELIPICEYPDGYYCIEQDENIVNWSNGEIDEHTWDSIWHWARDVWLTS